MSKNWHDKFISELASTGNVKQACLRARISRSTVYEARDKDPTFAAKWNHAKEDAYDDWEQEAARRAVDGVSSPIMDRNGKEVGELVKYSDRLLMFLLRGARPEKYGSRVTNKHEGTVTMTGLLSQSPPSVPDEEQEDDLQ